MITIINNVPMGSSMATFNHWLISRYIRGSGAIKRQSQFNTMYRDWDKVMSDNKKKKAQV